jgi:hypothetical protein
MTATLIWIDHLASIATIVGFPLVIIGLIQLYRERNHSMRDWRKLIAVGLLIVGFLAYGVDVADRFHWIGGDKIGAFSKWPEPYHPTTVTGRKFYNERVVLDGYFYSNCEFNNVTFVYNGTTAIQLANSKIIGMSVLASDNPAVEGAFAVTLAFNVAKDDVKILNMPPGNTIERMNVKPQQ